MEENTIYAIIHKRQGCCGWRNSHSVKDHQYADGVCAMPDWYGWTGSDDLATCHKIEDYREYFENLLEEGESIPDWAVYGTFDHDSRELVFFETENEAAEAMWSLGICSDWDYDLFTPREAADELIADDDCLGLYKQHITDLIDEAEDPEICELEWNLIGYIHYVLDEYDSGSREYCLADIAQLTTF